MPCAQENLVAWNNRRTTVGCYTGGHQWATSPGIHAIVWPTHTDVRWQALANGTIVLHESRSLISACTWACPLRSQPPSCKEAWTWVKKECGQRSWSSGLADGSVKPHDDPSYHIRSRSAHLALWERTHRYGFMRLGLEEIDSRSDFPYFLFQI